LFPKRVRINVGTFKKMGLPLNLWVKNDD